MDSAAHGASAGASFSGRGLGCHEQTPCMDDGTGFAGGRRAAQQSPHGRRSGLQCLGCSGGGWRRRWSGAWWRRRAPRRSTRRPRRRTSPRRSSASRSTCRPRVSSCCDRSARATSSPRVQAQLADPERDVLGTNLCAQHKDGCAGDVRLYDWGRRASASCEPVLFTARNGATISGHVWATEGGPGEAAGRRDHERLGAGPRAAVLVRRPTLAKAGYVVLTCDPQGQGHSDTCGEAPDQNEGVPAQPRPPVLRRHRGRARLLPLDAASARTCRGRAARPARATPPSRTAAWRPGLNAAYNPFCAAGRPERVGIAGHSLGAAGVSYVGQSDPRVDAIVAWDNLARAGGRAAAAAARSACPADPSRARARRRSPSRRWASRTTTASRRRRTPPTRTRWPRRRSRSPTARAGVDTGSSIIRGGTHYEFGFIPNPAFGGDAARHRHGRLVHDRLVRQVRQGRPGRRRAAADDRWRWRGQHSRSTTARGSTSAPTSFACEDLRSGCPGMVRRRLRGQLQLSRRRYLARRRNGMTVFTNAFFVGSAPTAGRRGRTSRAGRRA